MTIIAVFQLILLSISIYRKKESSKGKFILIFLLLLFGLFLSGNFVLIFKVNRPILNIAHILNLIVFLSAPLLYLFVAQKTDNRIKLIKKDFFHFVPFIIILGVMLLKIYHLDNTIFEYTNNGIVLIILLFLQNIIYLIVINKKLVNVGINFYKRNMSLNNLGAIWLKKLFLTFSIIIVLQLFVFVSCWIFNTMLLCIAAVGISFIITFILINNIILFGLSQSFVIDLKGKYQNTPINLYNKEVYINKLVKALDDDEVYLDPLLNLEKLSKKIHVPKNYLSQIVNDNYTLNFNELINKYRIEKVIEILNKNTGDTIIDIAYKAGFNAKSTFNTAFKKFTKMTPSQYLSRK